MFTTTFSNEPITTVTSSQLWFTVRTSLLSKNTEESKRRGLAWQLKACALESDRPWWGVPALSVQDSKHQV